MIKQPPEKRKIAIRGRSPEQARGESVDRRADIWAFGVVLFEMLSGRACFPGQTISDTIATVLRDEPDWKALPPHTPPLVKRLIRRCLAKDPHKRLRDIGDALPDLEDDSAEPPASPPPPARRPSRSWPRWVPWGLVALTAVAAGGAIYLLRSKKSASRCQVVRISMALPVPLDLGERDAVALSRDGHRLAFVGGEEGRPRIFIRDLSSFEARPLPGTEGGHTPFFSPDGEWLGFATSSQIMKISVRGGAAIALCPVNPVTRGAAWGEDGRIIFAESGRLMSVGASGGRPQALTKVDSGAGESAHLWPEILPGAKAVIFTVRTGESFDTARIVAQSLQTGSRKILVQNGTFGRYATSGHLLYMRGSAIIAVPFDAERLRVGPDPQPVIEGVRLDPRYGCGHFAVAASGTLIYLPGDARGTERRLVAVDRGGRERMLLDEPGAFLEPFLSPDGRQMVVAIEGTHQDLWLIDLPRRTLSRLSFEPDEEFSPRWTPDGRRIFHGYARMENEPEIYVRAADGGGSQEPVLAGGDSARFPGSIAPDGRTLAYVEIVTEDNGDIWVLPLGNGRGPQPFVKTPFNEFGPEFSPDGRSLAYVSNESGRLEVYVRPFPGPGPKRRVSVGGGTSPVWSKSGREIFYRQGDALMASVVSAGPEFSAARILFRGKYEEPARPDWPRNYDLTPDGREFVMIKPDPEGRPSQARVVLHWFEEMRRKSGFPARNP